MRGQVRGTARDRARTKSAINNYQASNYVRAAEGVAQCLNTEPKPRDNRSPKVPNRSPEVPKHCAIRWRHTPSQCPAT